MTQMRGMIPRRQLAKKPPIERPRVEVKPQPVSLPCGDVALDEDKVLTGYIFPSDGVITRASIYIRNLEGASEIRAVLKLNSDIIGTVHIKEGSNALESPYLIKRMPVKQHDRSEVVLEGSPNAVARDTAVTFIFIPK